MAEYGTHEQAEITSKRATQVHNLIQGLTVQEVGIVLCMVIATVIIRTAQNSEQAQVLAETFGNSVAETVREHFGKEGMKAEYRGAQP
jgi:uncharacterized protein YejL (UPF0352 family)